MPSVYVCRFPSSLSKAQKKDFSRAFVQKCLQTALQKEEVSIARKAQGKPYLPEHPDFFFNHSDSGDYAVLATDRHEIGVDVEVIRARDYAEVLKRFFAAEEAEAVLNAASEEERLSRFFRLWTSKESLLKQVGCGLGAEMSRYQVIDGKAVGADDLELRTYLLREKKVLDFDSHSAVTGDVMLTLCCKKGSEKDAFRFIPFDRG